MVLDPSPPPLLYTNFIHLLLATASAEVCAYLNITSHSLVCSYLNITLHSLVCSQYPDVPHLFFETASAAFSAALYITRIVAVCCNVLQCVAVCCSVCSPIYYMYADFYTDLIPFINTASTAFSAALHTINPKP